MSADRGSAAATAGPLIDILEIVAIRFMGRISAAC